MNLYLAEVSLTLHLCDKKDKQKWFKYYGFVCYCDSESELRRGLVDQILEENTLSDLHTVPTIRITYLGAGDPPKSWSWVGTGPLRYFSAYSEKTMVFNCQRTQSVSKILLEKLLLK